MEGTPVGKENTGENTNEHRSTDILLLSISKVSKRKINVITNLTYPRHLTQSGATNANILAN